MDDIIRQFYFFFFRLPEETDVAAFDDESASVIRLNNSTVLYMREINKVLALVCILREENFTKPGMYCQNGIYYFNLPNILILKKGHLSSTLYFIFYYYRYDRFQLFGTS